MHRIAAGLFSTIAVVLLLAPAAHAAPTERAVICWGAPSDIDLHVYDDQGHHAFYARGDAIPEAALSDDTITRGTESFTDQRDPSTRPLGYLVCYFESEVEPAPTTAVRPGHPAYARRSGKAGRWVAPDL